MTNKNITALTAATIPLDGTELVPLVQSGTTKKVTVENVLASVQPSGVANGVVYLNGSKIATSNSVLLFDGTNFGIGATPAYKVDVVSPSGAQSIFRAGQSGISNGFTISSNGATLSYQFDTGNIIQGTATKGINFTANTPAAGMTSQLLNWYEEGSWTPNQGAGLTLVGAFSSSGTYTRIGRSVTVHGAMAGATSIAIAAGTPLTSNLPFSGSKGLGLIRNAAYTAISGASVITTGLYCVVAMAATTDIAFTVTYEL